jgi:acetoin utilization deacetylase AcuC-like enzyme
MNKMDVFFHPEQLEFAPKYEWALGNRIKHPESTKRAESIFKALSKDARFQLKEPKKIATTTLRTVHDFQLWTLYNSAKQLADNESFYPSVFLKNEQIRPDPTNLRHAGFYCFDSGTPLDNKTLKAASWSAACALDATKHVMSGKSPIAYALSRPPGHHASYDTYGGYCYFNNAAIAAHELKKKGRVAILDIDFHHGNGTQKIFYKDPNVLVVSIHGDPRQYFPYFMGFPHETGIEQGAGLNLNIILPTGTKYKAYEKALNDQAIPTIQAFDPAHLIISAGFDTYKLDPIGKFELETPDYHQMAKLLNKLNIPTVILQEGGYHTKDLGLNVHSFLTGYLS